MKGLGGASSPSCSGTNTGTGSIPNPSRITAFKTSPYRAELLPATCPLTSWFRKLGRLTSGLHWFVSTRVAMHRLLLPR